MRPAIHRSTHLQPTAREGVPQLMGVEPFDPAFRSGLMRPTRSRSSSSTVVGNCTRRTFPDFVR